MSGLLNHHEGHLWLLTPNLGDVYSPLISLTTLIALGISSAEAMHPNSDIKFMPVLHMTT